MPVSAVSSASSSQAAQTAEAAALQEATETPTVTAQEAARGDRQAMRLLARQQQTQIQPTTSSPKPAAGSQVDHLA